MMTMLSPHRQYTMVPYVVSRKMYLRGRSISEQTEKTARTAAFSM